MVRAPRDSMTNGKRLLIYSHDSFGLGHLRRCRAIAHELVAEFENLSVLILSGSPIIGSFDFRARVDFVRIPGVIKLRNGEYTSLALHIDINKTLEIRSSIIEHTAEIFAPDIFLVDKEPLGLRGEVDSTLKLLRRSGTRCVLGLRDVMDDPAPLADEWKRKGVYPALKTHFDDIWVYGLPEIFDPVREIENMSQFADKTHFTGYLRRAASPDATPMYDFILPEEPFILVTTGGGGDGSMLIDLVLSAYEIDPTIPYNALVVLGPFMHADERLAFQRRASVLSKVTIVTFDAHIERLFTRAVGVVTMGGYNTFCEIVSFQKPSLVVPRTKPRREQWLRSVRAEKLGILKLFDLEVLEPVAAMARELHDAAHWPRVSSFNKDRMLVGHERIAELARADLTADTKPPTIRTAVA
ncbi:MAG: glycosyltransferase [Pseudomonadota bacterium]